MLYVRIVQHKVFVNLITNYLQLVHKQITFEGLSTIFKASTNVLAIYICHRYCSNTCTKVAY